MATNRLEDKLNYINFIAGLMVAGITVLIAPASNAGVEFADPTRPIAVVIGQNEFTEITDFLVPYAVLSASGVFNVVSVSTSEGPVNLWPNLTAEMTTTLSNVDQDLPKPPDLIVIPAVHDHDDPALMNWLRRHAARGAFIASICDGVFVTASAGLLDGKVATGHFYSADKRQGRFKNVTWVKDKRYVESGNMMSTSGVSASLPASLKLVEKFAGAEKAQQMALTYGVDDYGPDHDSSLFKFGIREWWMLLKNVVRRNADYDIVLEDGIDEFSLGFTLDLLSRTLRASVDTVGKTERVKSAHGLTLIPSKLRASFDGDELVELPLASGHGWKALPSRQATLIIENPASAIDTILSHIRAKFGSRTANLTATQLELIWQ